jgi:hypothetical protein
VIPGCDESDSCHSRPITAANRSKPFFFAKKNQKTLVYKVFSVALTRAPNGQKFLLLFSKRSAFFLSMRQPQGKLV